jgi:hypothetical protein
MAAILEKFDLTSHVVVSTGRAILYASLWHSYQKCGYEI